MKALSKLRKEKKYTPEVVARLKDIFKGTKMASDYNTSNHDCLDAPDEMEYELLTLMMKHNKQETKNIQSEPLYTVYLNSPIDFEELGLDDEDGYVDELNIYHCRLGLSGGECYDAFWAWLSEEEKTTLFPVLKELFKNPDNFTTLPEEV